jgi:hypothetical protein
MADKSINTLVFEKIKEGSIKNVIFFGDMDKMPPPPYVVIKQEAGENRIVYRFIAHAEMGSQDMLDAYIRYELDALLKDVKTNTGTIKFYSTGEWFGVQARSDDNTISMERTFFVPIISV